MRLRRRAIPSYLLLPASLLLATQLHAQIPSQPPTSAPTSPAVAPAGVDTPKPSPKAAQLKPAVAPISAKQAEAAENAYLRGAKAIERHDDLRTAEDSFAEAVRLAPGRQEYALALAVTRDHRLQQIVQEASKAHLLGHEAEAEALLEEARKLDPTNAVVAQHFGANVEPLPDQLSASTHYANDVATLAGPPEFAPTAGEHDFHIRGDSNGLAKAVYAAWGITLQTDAELTNKQNIRLDLSAVDFATATHVVHKLTHTFAVPIDGKLGLLAPDTPDAHDRLTPLLEETVYFPGSTPDQLSEFQNVARNIFDVQKVAASGAAGELVLRADEPTLKLLNATYAGMQDSGSDVLLEMTFYEIDTSKIQNIGATSPQSIGVFPVLSEAENLISSNQSLIQEAVGAGLLTLTGNSQTNALLELEFLLASGQVTSSEFTNILGVLGHYGGLPLAGVYLGEGSTFNFSLNSSDIRVLDAITLRSSNHQEATFRSGTRYPIETGIYSNGGTSALTSQLAGLTVNGQSVSSLLSQYLGSGASTSVPQIQYEDLGITLKTTSNVQRSNEVNLKLDLKIEALGSGSFNTLPVLNSRAFTSAITVPQGKTAILVSHLSTNDIRAINGIPFLSEIPGFQGTDKSYETDTTELLIAITPHIVRNAKLHIATRPLAMDRPASHGN